MRVEQIVVHSWPPEARPCPLTPGEIHLWWAFLDVEARHADAWFPTISRDERTRADRFRMPKHRASFVAARGLLRAILSRYLDVAPGDLRFAYGPWGKPTLAHPVGRGSDFHFNLAHAQGVALFAIARGRAVGVDVEQVRELPDVAAFARRWLSPQELVWFDALEAPLKVQAFLELWVRREACAKATGMGLSLHPWHSEGESSPWSVRTVGAPPGYVAALAYAARQEL